MYKGELPRWKLGIYKPTWERKTTDTDIRIAYFDNIRIGNENANYDEMNPSITNKTGWGPYIPEIKSFTLINAYTNKVVRNIADNETINIKSLNTDKITLRANFDESFDGSILFNLKGPKSLNYVDNSTPFSIYGDESELNYYNNGGTPVGDYILTATTYAERSQNGKIGSTKTIKFKVINEEVSNSNIPSVSGFTLIKANVNQEYGPLKNGDIINLEEIGTSKLSVKANFSSTFNGEVRFKLSGKVNRDYTAFDQPYTLYGYNNGNYSFGDTGLPPGEYELETTPVVIENGITNFGESKVIKFNVVESIEQTILTTNYIKNLTLVKANTDTDYGPLTNGSVFLANQLGTHKLTIRANMIDGFKGSVLFELSGPVKRTAMSTSYAPYVLNGFKNGNYSFGEGLPIGSYSLRLTPHLTVDAKEAIGEILKINFTIK